MEKVLDVPRRSFLISQDISCWKDVVSSKSYSKAYFDIVTELLGFSGCDDLWKGN